MSWITTDDLVAAFGKREIIELTDRDEPRTGAIDSVVGARAIAEAEDIASGLLRRRYPDWPSPTIPPGVKVRVADIARRRLYVNAVPDVVGANYEDALDWLARAVFSDAEMGVATGEGIGNAVAAGSKTLAYGADFADAFNPLEVEPWA